MKNKFFLLMASVASILLLGSCDDDSEVGAGDSGNAERVDVTVVVPIHPSSLDYFDYVIHYRDNQGDECRDTIQGSSGGITVDDWNYLEYEVVRTASTSNGGYLVRTFSYDNLSVSCTVTVGMLPKTDASSLSPFFFIIPKPYIFPNAYGPVTPPTNAMVNHVAEKMESIRVDSMSVKSFQETYGTSYSSQCVVNGSLDEYEFFY